MPEKKPNARKEKNEKKTTKIVDAIKNAVKALIDVGFYIFIWFLSGHRHRRFEIYDASERCY